MAGDKPPLSQAEPAQALVFSAPTQEALRDRAQLAVARLQAADASLPSAAAHAVANDGGEAHRLVVVAKSCAQAADRLASFLQGQPSAGVHHGVAQLQQPTPVALVFSGQGTQWWGMGRQLLAQDATFRSTVERVAELLAGQVPWSLLEELQRGEADTRLGETEVAQPALFAVQAALFAVLQRMGVVPAVVVGHSIGEVAAAHAAGVLSLEDATRLAAIRGKLMQEATGRGKMLSADLSAQEGEAWAAKHGSAMGLAVVNGPRSVVFAGDTEAVQALAVALGQAKVSTRWLPVNYAFHSPHMDAMAPRLGQALGGLQRQAAQVPIVSTLTGQLADAAAYTAPYWQRQMREPVRFASAIEGIIDAGITVFLEVGPHPALGTHVHEILAARSVEGGVAFTLRRNVAERDSLFNALGALHCRGVRVNWAGS